MAKGIVHPDRCLWIVAIIASCCGTKPARENCALYLSEFYGVRISHDVVDQLSMSWPVNKRLASVNNVQNAGCVLVLGAKLYTPVFRLT